MTKITKNKPNYLTSKYSYYVCIVNGFYIF